VLPLVEAVSNLRRQPYCFEIRRMRIVWRKADQHYDEAGRPANLTIASSRARRDWAELLWVVMEGDCLVRIRHQHRDEPAILVSESRFRDLERRADRFDGTRGDPAPPLAPPPPPPL